MKKIFIVRLISLISVFIFSFITLINVNTVKADNIFDKKEVFTDFNIPSKYNLENIEIKTDKKDVCCIVVTRKKEAMIITITNMIEIGRASCRERV